MRSASPRVRTPQVSLSLLLAAALEGSGSSVLLLDEVDAALDEVNQKAMARLLHGLAHGTLLGSHGEGAPLHAGKRESSGQRGAGAAGAAGVQVLCVSHHATCQSAADALVQVRSGSEAVVAFDLAAPGGARACRFCRCTRDLTRAYAGDEARGRFRGGQVNKGNQFSKHLINVLMTRRARPGSRSWRVDAPPLAPPYRSLLARGCPRCRRTAVAPLPCASEPPRAPSAARS